MNTRPGKPIPPFFQGLFLAAVVLVVLGVMVGVTAVAVEDMSEEFYALVGTLLIAGACLLALGGTGFVIHAGRMRVVAVLGMGSVCVAAVLFLWLIWFDTMLGRRFENMLGQAAAAALLIGFSMIHSAAFWNIPTKLWLLQILRWLVMGAAWLSTGFMVLLMYWEDRYFMSDVVFILPFAGALVVVIGTVGYPIAALHRRGGHRQTVESLESSLQVHFACPRCGEKQELQPGHVRCAKCRRALFVEIEEPRCECGYLLYQLTSAVCPECGRPVPPELRWHEVTAETSARDRGESRPGTPD